MESTKFNKAGFAVTLSPSWFGKDKTDAVWVEFRRDDERFEKAFPGYDLRNYFATSGGLFLQMDLLRDFIVEAKLEELPDCLKLSRGGITLSVGLVKTLVNLEKFRYLQERVRELEGSRQELISVTDVSYTRSSATQGKNWELRSGQFAGSFVPKRHLIRISMLLDSDPDVEVAIMVRRDSSEFLRVGRCRNSGVENGETLISTNSGGNAKILTTALNLRQMPEKVDFQVRVNTGSDVCGTYSVKIHELKLWVE
jgi:hypothetical protein